MKLSDTELKKALKKIANFSQDEKEVQEKADEQKLPIQGLHMCWHSKGGMYLGMVRNTDTRNVVSF